MTDPAPDPDPDPDPASAPARLRRALEGTLAFGLAAWVLDAPGRLGAPLYLEQYLAAAAGLATAICLLARPRPAAADVALALAALAAGLVAAALYPRLSADLAAAGPGVVALGLGLIALVTEASRRRTGPFLPGLFLGLVAVALWLGPHLPAGLATRAVAPQRLAIYLAFDTNGLLSPLLAVAAVGIAPFLIFGALLNGYGAGAALTLRVARLVGRSPGGAAKAAVVGSAAFGVVSGSAVANVSTVGALTIPMMTRAGYAPHEAAAIESVGSTGGQLMPPMLGAASFLMAEYLEVPFRDVALASLAPALLYYLALFLAIDFDARRDAVRPVAAAPAGAIAAPPAAWRYLIPVVVLIHALFFAGRPPQTAGLAATAALVAVHLAWPLRGVGARLRRTGALILDGAGVVADIVVLAAVSALVIGVLNVTGLAFAATLRLLDLSGGSMAGLLAISAAVCMVLGLGLPTVGVYVLVAALAAPALQELGAPPMAAHLFLLYFGMLSMITPPVAMASFAAAAIAEADPWRASWRAMGIAAMIYLLPVAFVTQPALVLAGDPGALDVALALLRTALAVALGTAALAGHVARPLGPAARLAAAALVAPNLAPLGTGLAEMGAVAGLALGTALLAASARPAPARGPLAR